MKDYKLKVVIRFFMFILFVLVLSALISSCTSLEKAVKVATTTEANATTTQHAIHKAYPLATAQFHAKTYPPKVTEVTKVVVEPGNSAALKGQLQQAEQEADSLKRYLATLKVKDVCWPEVTAREKVIAQLQQRISALNRQSASLTADVERVTTTRTEESTAAVEAERLEHEETKGKLQEKAEELQQVTANRDEWKEKAKQRFWALVAIGAFAVLFIVFKVLAARVRI